MRTLALVLDDECEIYLPLFEGENSKVDEFTTKNFESSDDIRLYYKDKIEDFLDKKRVYLFGKKNFRGRIVLLENVNGKMYKSRVLYKDALIVAKEALENPKVMNCVVAIDSNGRVNNHIYSKLEISYKRKKMLLSPFVRDIIKRYDYPTKTNLKSVKQWLKSSKENYYEKIRLLVLSYIQARKIYPDLKTPSTLYREYKESVSSVKEEKKDYYERKTSDYVDIGDFSYPIDCLPFDNDQLIEMGINVFDGTRR